MSDVHSLLGQIKSPIILDLLEAELMQMASTEGLKLKLLFRNINKISKKEQSQDGFQFLVNQIFIEKWTEDIADLDVWYRYMGVKDAMLNFKKSLSVSRFLGIENWQIFLDGDLHYKFNYGYNEGIHAMEEFFPFQKNKMSEYEIVLKISADSKKINEIITQMSKVRSSDIIKHYFRNKLVVTNNPENEYIRNILKLLKKNKEISPAEIKTLDLDNFEKVLILYNELIFDDLSDEEMKKRTLSMYEMLGVERKFQERFTNVPNILIYDQKPD